MPASEGGAPATCSFGQRPAYREQQQQKRGDENKLHGYTTRAGRGLFHNRRVKVGVVGLGTMGAGIAQISVTAGHDTVSREVNSELAARGRDTIERYLGRAVEKGRMTAKSETRRSRGSS